MASGQALEAPLMGGESEDPFYAFREELEGLVGQSRGRFSRWKSLLETTDTWNNREFKAESQALTKELASIGSNISDLEQVLQRVQTHRSKFSHISDDELVKRQTFIREMKNEVNSMKAAMSSAKTQSKIEQDRQQNLLRKGGNPSVNSNAGYIEEQQQRQQLIMRQQDEHLDELEQGATRLGHMAVAIGEEIDQQNDMLDALQDDMDQTAGRMEAILGRMDKMLKSNSRCQTNTILVLMAVLIVLIFLVAWT